jgi:hypothetical protein
MDKVCGLYFVKSGETLLKYVHLSSVVLEIVHFYTTYNLVFTD